MCIRDRDKNVGITKFISRLYTKALGRNTDVQGLNAWADVILSGRETPEKVAFGILFSDEFKNKGLSNEEYLNVLYRVFMGREADPVGLAAWKKMLDEGWRRDVIFYGFSKSDEFSEILGSFGLQQTVGEAVYVDVYKRQMQGETSHFDGCNPRKSYRLENRRV